MPEQHIPVDRAAELLQSCLRRLVDLAVEGYCERGTCLSSWRITPLSMLKTELCGVRSDVDATTCTTKLCKTQIESLDSWGVWFLSYFPGSRSRRLYYQVHHQLQLELQRNLQDEPQKIADSLTAALLPLWSLIRRIALIALVNDKSPDTGDVLFCLTGNMKSERDQSDPVRSVAVHLISDLKETKRQESSSENTKLLDQEVVDIDNMKDEWTSSCFKRRALRTAATYFGLAY